MKNKSKCLSIFCFLKTLFSFPNEFLGVAPIDNTFSDVVHKGNTFLIFTISKILFKTLLKTFTKQNRIISKESQCCDYLFPLLKNRTKLNRDAYAVYWLAIQLISAL
jgi:hypothetical protein